jgi:hypothetical protein
MAGVCAPIGIAIEASRAAHAGQRMEQVTQIPMNI